MLGDVIQVTGVLRRHDQILLVRSPSLTGFEGDWELPGGNAAPGELLVDALVRTVRQRTSINVERVGDLIHVAQILHSAAPESADGEPPLPARSTLAFTFEITAWSGEVDPTVPAGNAGTARFWPRNDAITLLDHHAVRPVREPLLAYLRREEHDRVWLYREDDGGNDALEWPIRAQPTEASEQVRRARALIALGCIVVLVLLIVIVIIGVITLARPFA